MYSRRKLNLKKNFKFLYHPNLTLARYFTFPLF